MVRERILVGGPSGAGKTYSFLKIAEHLSGGHHAAIEVDDGFTRMLELEFPALQATIFDLTDAGWAARGNMKRGTNLRIFHCAEFGAVRAAQTEIESQVARGESTNLDWICMDGVDLIYNMQRQEYVTKASAAMRAVPGKDAWEAALERRAAGAPILEPADWDAINSFYEPMLAYFSYQVPMHFYATTAVEVIDPTSKFVSSAAKELAKQLGLDIKFEGQKRTPRNFDTLMSLRSDSQGHYTSIFKDRGGQGREWAKLVKAGQQAQSITWTCDCFYHSVGVKLFGWENIDNGCPARPT